MKRLVAIACLGLAAAGLCARLSSAAFTASTSIASSPVTVDKLANYFSVTPLNGTVASGGVDNLALDFGTVASARTFTSVFQVTNVSGASRTALLTVSGIPSQISAVAFSGGGTSATLAAGASATVNVTTSSTVAGRGSGTLRLARLRRRRRLPQSRRRPEGASTSRGPRRPRRRISPAPTSTARTEEAPTPS